jgi:ribonuclease P protein component
MIARLHRFHGYGSLRGVYSRGQTLRSPLVSLKFAVRDPRRPYRAAVVVSRKVNKSAVVRNRIRRRIYEIIRRQEGGLPTGLELVFTVFSDEIATIEAGKLEDTVNDLVHKAVKSSTNVVRSPAQPHGIVKPIQGNR